ncbi:MAG TPA: hypothetical protein VGG64_14020 [Pirellulales bacterium]|jgi:hypothetical protein|nr:hypothetical protein [Pirellulales bacterium]
MLIERFVPQLYQPVIHEELFVGRQDSLAFADATAEIIGVLHVEPGSLEVREMLQNGIAGLQPQTKSGKNFVPGRFLKLDAASADRGSPILVRIDNQPENLNSPR